MRQLNLKVTLLLAGIAACGVAAAGGRGMSTPLPPTIVKSAVNVNENILVISGRNFGATPPTVLLAEQALDVKNYSESEIVAHLPQQLAPATYGLLVITTGEQNRARSNLFSATLVGNGEQ